MGDGQKAGKGESGIKWTGRVSCGGVYGVEREGGGAWGEGGGGC